MRLLRLDEVQTAATHRVFRYSRARALFLAVAVICTSAGLIVFDWGDDLRSVTTSPACF
jgi:hypothetical protein